MSTEKTQQKKSKFESQLLDLARVTKVTRGGRQLKFRATMVIGDRNGKVGIGTAKGLDVARAVEKATRRAKKNLIEFPLDGHSIPYEVEAKFGSSRVLLLPQMKGRGLVAGGVVRTICDIVGIQDISSKILTRSRNKLNIAWATIKALDKIKPLEEKNKYATT